MGPDLEIAAGGLLTREGMRRTEDCDIRQGLSCQNASLAWRSSYNVIHSTMPEGDANLSWRGMNKYLKSC